MYVDIIYCILLLCACETGEKEIKRDEVNGAILGRDRTHYKPAISGEKKIP